jgi:hypothetical protein
MDEALFSLVDVGALKAAFQSSLCDISHIVAGKASPNCRPSVFQDKAADNTCAMGNFVKRQ